MRRYKDLKGANIGPKSNFVDSGDYSIDDLVLEGLEYNSFIFYLVFGKGSVWK
jgi:hypothetical protein